MGAGAPDQFGFDRLEHSFHHGIVIAIAPAAHRGDVAVPASHPPVMIGAILAATIRVMQNARPWLAQDERALQGGKRQIYFQAVADRPADNTA